MVGESNFWQKKVDLDKALGDNRSQFRTLMANMTQEMHSIYAQRDAKFADTIHSEKQFLVDDIKTNPVSLLDGISGIAALLSSSEWASSRLAQMPVPGTPITGLNLNYNPGIPVNWGLL
jgi:hypothetical protein